MDKTACLFLLISFCWGCSSSSTTEKFQDERDNIINVRDQIKEIPIGDLLIGYSLIWIWENYEIKYETTGLFRCYMEDYPYICK